ncbi:thiol peroxidase [Clostridium acetobutylicum]|uniref:Thiol peroxidase n=1 Tax=Clostridium acetobutylicum (strain ATCC 824 / DSM 792 / JCM 1419 / IAM 19013 / LMG 5710 / NBRC 13948 / NRRL B-527 / VKM B-1787 / 2291 / W) TaxID=272562 RepID=TPX_CLOAB|nr:MULTISPECIES: thiol peroxidase [Clostridium]Q97E14.1 RecName: Full=Thiol peroxidase; Short=Tpx; AltName: Full=Peroxiredoxin tpx; Short=Prx; AltName: Full=Thioredoxin peroxidase; AltName: Full=Thioredoxin-dependent peroxiredoxin [Clostridium acetobutylicum ATCC 824]AAK81238.1 Thiol peroxidase, TPX [Clostridium acetobutylicum ATCC 824]ADZ22345.1 Thiol peroxidase, TPX [Clostridium acetobutylicum EA 2018]AEI33495.1 thiol peroxidase [Clostridium acetobutylicum DSM 1731]AWV81092.1 thiol peroxidas
MKVKFKGKEVTLEGTEIKVGDTFPDFVAVNSSLEPVMLKNTNRVRVFLAVPSVDTPVCDLEVKTFNARASEIDGVSIYTISMDLPFAQSRWCGAEGIKNVTTLSDYRDRAFGKNTGTYIKELGLLARAVFVVDSSNKVTYANYLEEVSGYPNYDEVLQAAQAAK